MRNLQLEGYEVLTADDGEQALGQVEVNSPDLILLDVILPGLDGFQACQRVREFSVVPIICMTARGHDQEKGRLLKLGADDYLTKPFAMSELLTRIHAVLHTRLMSYTPGEALPPTTIGDLAVNYARSQVMMAGRVGVYDFVVDKRTNNNVLICAVSAWTGYPTSGTLEVLRNSYCVVRYPPT